MRILSLVVLTVISGVTHAHAQSFTLSDSYTNSFAGAHVTAGGGPGNGTVAFDDGNVLSEVATGASDSNSEATCTVALASAAIVLPNQLTTGSGWQSTLWSHNGDASVTGNPPGGYDVAGFNTGEDRDGDGIDDGIDANTIDETGAPIIRPDANGNGIDDLIDQINSSPLLATHPVTTANARGDYVFTAPPGGIPPGSVMVAYGSWAVNAKDNENGSEGTAGVTAPGVQANAASGNNGMYSASTVTDVLSGRITTRFGGEGQSGGWSVIVLPGPANPFRMTANTNTGIVDQGSASNGALEHYASSATANIEIEGVLVVSANSLPPLVLHEGTVFPNDPGAVAPANFNQINPILRVLMPGVADMWDEIADWVVPTGDPPDGGSGSGDSESGGSDYGDDYDDGSSDYGDDYDDGSSSDYGDGYDDGYDGY